MSWTIQALLFAALLALLGMAGRPAWIRCRASSLANRFLARHYPDYLTTPKTHKVLFVHPTTRQEDGTLYKEKRVNSPALTLPLLAALTPPNWDVEICYETCEEVPFDTDADLVAMTNMGHSLWRARELAREFRNRGRHVVIGGTMSSLIPDWVQDHCDTLFVGDAEEVWPQFISDFEARKPRSRYEELSKHPVGNMPLPRYDLLLGKPHVGPLIPVQIARGCPYRCRFCTINALSQGAYTPRPVDQIVRDVRSVQELGCNNFFFLDDNIAGDRAFSRELFRAIEPLGVRWVSQSTLDILKEENLLREAVQSGCITLCFGLESLEQKSLRKVAKGFYKASEYISQISAIRETGLMQSAEFIIGLDHDTPETIDALADFIVDQGIPIVRCYIYAPIPGTPVWSDFKSSGRLLSEDYTRIGGASVGFQPVHFTPEELLASYWTLMDRVYSWRGIWRRVYGRRNQGWINPMLAFVANLQYRRLVKRRTIPGLA